MQHIVDFSPNVSEASSSAQSNIVRKLNSCVWAAFAEYPSTKRPVAITWAIEYIKEIACEHHYTESIAITQVPDRFTPSTAVGAPAAPQG